MCLPTCVLSAPARLSLILVQVYCGIGATGAFYVSSAAKVAGFGSLLTVRVLQLHEQPTDLTQIGLSYMAGIVLAIIIAGNVSGGHLSPCYTIAFWLFKGFPAKKVLPFIAAQIFGGFVAAILVYGVYRQQFDAVAAALTAAKESALIFTPLGVRLRFSIRDLLTFPARWSSRSVQEPRPELPQHLPRRVVRQHVPRDRGRLRPRLVERLHCLLLGAVRDRSRLLCHDRLVRPQLPRVEHCP